MYNNNNNNNTKKPFSKSPYQRKPFGKRPERPESPYDSKLLDLRRVTRVTKGGKQMSFRAVIVLGDRKGQVAVATGKGKDVAQAVEKATRKAKKNFVKVPMKGGTIPHEVFAKYSAARVMLKPQKPGRGLIAGGTTRVICSFAGISDITSKMMGGTKNKLNNAMATIKALKMLKINNETAKAVKKAKPEDNDPSKPRLVKKND